MPFFTVLALPGALNQEVLRDQNKRFREAPISELIAFDSILAVLAEKSMVLHSYDSAERALAYYGCRLCVPNFWLVGYCSQTASYPRSCGLVWPVYEAARQGN